MEREARRLSARRGLHPAGGHPLGLLPAKGSRGKRQQAEETTPCDQHGHTSRVAGTQRFHYSYARHSKPEHSRVQTATHCASDRSSLQDCEQQDQFYLEGAVREVAGSGCATTALAISAVTSSAQAGSMVSAIH